MRQMTFDADLLAQAFEKKARDRSRRELLLEERRKKVFRQIPELAENDRLMRKTAAEAVLTALKSGTDPKAAAEALRDENLELQAREVDLLASYGYRPDYLQNSPECQVCSDSGLDGTSVCSCVRKIYAKLQTRQLDKKLDFSVRNFEKFDLSLYSPVEDRKRGISPRENMKNNLEICKEYALGFGSRSSNLAFFGDTGLGKTFLSACIAKVVSESGFFVIYGSAGEIFSDYESEKFSRDKDSTASASRYTQCSLLILDDLGTEMTTQFTVSALYNLLNSRLMGGKKTIITSNLNIKDLRTRYTPQIMSRLEGEFRNLAFFGDDIRMKRKERM